MVIFEVFFRAATAFFSKSGISLLFGAFLSSFLMINSPDYSQFFIDINQYLIHFFNFLIGYS